MRRTIIALMLIVGSSACSPAKDGQSTFDRMLAAYQKLNSYSHVLNTTRFERIDDDHATSAVVTTFKFKRPNLVYLAVTSPDKGTIVSVCDGKQQLIYLKRYNVFRRLPAPANLTGIMKNLAPYGVGSLMDAIELLQGTPPGGRLGSIKEAGNTTVNGNHCDIVTARLLPTGILPGATGNAKFYIDKKNYMLRKLDISYVKAPITRRRMAVKNGKSVSVVEKKKLDLNVTDFATKLAANPVLDAKDFTFTPPKGAKEQTGG